MNHLEQLEKLGEVDMPRSWRHPVAVRVQFGEHDDVLVSIRGHGRNIAEAAADCHQKVSKFTAAMQKGAEAVNAPINPSNVAMALLRRITS